MRVFRSRLAKKNPYRNTFLSNWRWAIPVLLIVAALSMRKIDCCPPATDEYTSMWHAGWLVNGPYTPLDVIESLQRYSPDHTPGYFITLSIWGNLTSYELASGRLLSILAGLLALAIAYRLARDFIAPEAAFFVIVILASNAFYNFYYAHTRMYTLFVLMAGSVLWLYLRSLEQTRPLKARDCFALGAASLYFLSLHLFSVVFMLPLGLYHLLFAQKNRRWLAITLTGIITSSLAAPWLLIAFSRGISAGSLEVTEQAGGTWDNLSATLAVFGNGQALLLAVAIAAVFLAALVGRVLPKSILLLGAIHILLIVVLSATAPELFTTNSGFRYLLPALLIFALILAAAVYRLFRFWQPFAVLLALWIVFGLHFQATATWQPFIGGIEKTFLYPPWQKISRMTSSPPPPLIITFKINFEKWSFSWNRRITSYPQRLHYFGTKAIVMTSTEELPATKSTVANNAVNQERIWILYDRRDLIEGEYDGLLKIMDGFDYDLCETINVGAHWSILDFYWDNLDCEDLELISEPRTSNTKHKFYDARLSRDGSQLSIVDSWSATAEFESDYFATSYQLLSEDWDNVAQLDLPMVHEGLTRRFSLGTSDLPPGAYRLMLIVYDTRTGKAADWIDNPGSVPSMFELSRFAVPG